MRVQLVQPNRATIARSHKSSKTGSSILPPAPRVCCSRSCRQLRRSRPMASPPGKEWTWELGWRRRRRRQRRRRRRRRHWQLSGHRLEIQVASRKATQGNVLRGWERQALQFSALGDMWGDAAPARHPRAAEPRSAPHFAAAPPRSSRCRCLLLLGPRLFCRGTPGNRCKTCRAQCRPS